MPWLSLLLALLTYLSADKSTPEAQTKALLSAGLVGAGSYAVTHATDWGKANLGELDGVMSDTVASTKTVTVNGTDYSIPVGTDVKLDSDGNVVLDSDGKPTVGYKAPENDGTGGWLSETANVLKSWGGTGTAAVIGTTALASSSTLQSYVPYLIIGAVALLILK